MSSLSFRIYGQLQDCVVESSLSELVKARDNMVFCPWSCVTSAHDPLSPPVGAAQVLSVSRELGPEDGNVGWQVPGFKELPT